jgi:hypothetical protein
MGQAISTEHPAVVLRSRYQQLRALLAVAMVAVIGLTVAVVILAADHQQVGETSRIGQVYYGAVSPTTDMPDATEGHVGTGPDESRTAAAIGGGAPAESGGPDESVVAGAVSGR